MKKKVANLASSFEPRLAIMVYRNSDKDIYLESHDVDSAGRILEGRPLKTETIAGIVEIFKDRYKKESMISGAIPAYLLSYAPKDAGQYELSWHRPAEQRTIYFDEKLHIPSGLASVPPLLFTATAGSLNVRALLSNERPGEKPELYYAPFHNVDSGGSVCLGSAKAKAPAKKTFENVIAYWEEMFWKSKFTHLGYENPIDGNINIVWQELVENPDRPFPLKVLKPTKPIQTLTNEL